MEILAVAAAALCALVSLSTFRFQRFTLSVARDMDDSRDPRKVRALQQSMTPAWIRQLDYLGYLLAIAAIVFGSQELGWVWGIAIIVAMLFGRGLVSPVWPLPSMRQCVAFARGEANRGLARARSDNDRATQQVYDGLIARLDSVRMT